MSVSLSFKDQVRRCDKELRARTTAADEGDAILPSYKREHENGVDVRRGTEENIHEIQDDVSIAYAVPVPPERSHLDDYAVPNNSSVRGAEGATTGFRKHRCKRASTVLVVLLFCAVVVAGGYCGTGKCSQSPNPPSQDDPPTPLSPLPDCTLNVDTTCIYNEGAFGQTCNNIPLTMDSSVGGCSVLPTSLTMLYNGGDCSQSDNVDLYNFTCEDKNGGPPLDGDARIVVTNEDTGIVYFQDVVSFQELFTIFDNGKSLGTNLMITISSSLDNTLYQVVRSASSFCGHGDLALFNRFGSAQLVAFADPSEGVQTGFTMINFEVSIEAPAEISSGDSVTLTSIVATTSVSQPVPHPNPGEYTLAPGDTETIPLPYDGVLDFTEVGSHVILVNVEGSRSPDFAKCTGSGSVTLTYV